MATKVTTLRGKTLFITGASRGIGLAIALRAARDGANIAIAAKSDQPQPKLEGTIHSAAAEVEKAGGEALMRMSRTPEIMADAAQLILTQVAKSFTGRFCIDDTLLYEHGVRDFEKYRVDQSTALAPDFFVPDSMPPPPGVKLAAPRR